MKVMEIGRNYYTLSGIGEIYKPQVDTEDVFADILDAELLQRNNMTQAAKVRTEAGIQPTSSQTNQAVQTAGTTVDTAQRTDGSRLLAMSVLIGGMVHNVSTKITEPVAQISDETARKRSRITVGIGL